MNCEKCKYSYLGMDTQSCSLEQCIFSNREERADILMQRLAEDRYRLTEYSNGKIKPERYALIMTNTEYALLKDYCNGHTPQDGGHTPQDGGYGTVFGMQICVVGG